MKDNIFLKKDLVSFYEEIYDAERLIYTQISDALQRINSIDGILKDGGLTYRAETKSPFSARTPYPHEVEDKQLLTHIKEYLDWLKLRINSTQE